MLHNYAESQRRSLGHRREGQCNVNTDRTLVSANSAQKIAILTYTANSRDNSYKCLTPPPKKKKCFNIN
jgi:hypothetical protein